MTRKVRPRSAVVTALLVLSFCAVGWRYRLVARARQDRGRVCCSKTCEAGDSTMFVEAKKPFSRGFFQTHAWEKSLAESPEGIFRDVTSGDPFPAFEVVRAESMGWAEAALKPDANPHLAPMGSNLSRCEAGPRTVDTLRYRYTVDGVALDLTENTYSMMVRVACPVAELIGGGDEATIARISSIASRLLKTHGQYVNVVGQRVPYILRFQYAPPLAIGSVFSTGPDGWTGVGNWPERLDGGLDERGLYFMIYKAQGGESVLPLDAKHWFAAENKVRAAPPTSP
jgi:hypothetical protein